MTTCPHSDRCVCIGACKHGFAGNGASEFSPASTRRATAVGKHARGVLSGLQRGPDTATERHWQARVDALDAAIAALQAALSAEPVAWQYRVVWTDGDVLLDWTTCTERQAQSFGKEEHHEVRALYLSPVAGGAVAEILECVEQLSAKNYMGGPFGDYVSRIDRAARALAVTAPDSTQPLLSAQGAGVSNAADSTGRDAVDDGGPYNGIDWPATMREALRLCYVELFHCAQQLQDAGYSVKDGGSVRTALAAGKAALDASPTASEEDA